MKPSYLAKAALPAIFLLLTVLTLTGCVPNLIKQPPAGNASNPTHVQNPVPLEVDWNNVQLTSGPAMWMDGSDITSQFSFNGTNALAHMCLTAGSHQFSVSARQNPTPHLINEVLSFLVDTRLMIAPVTAVQIAPGSSQTITINIQRGANFTDDVQLTLSGLPNGVSGPATPAHIIHPGNSASLTLSSTAAAIPGSTPVTVTATSICALGCSCVETATANLALTVVAPAFQLRSVTPADPVLERDGASQSVQVALTRTGGNTSAATVTLTGLPAGVSATPSALSIPGTTSSGSITLKAGLDAALGHSTVRYAATGTGVTGAPLTAHITVVPKTGAFTAVQTYTRNVSTNLQATVGAPGNPQRMATVRSNTTTTANQDFQAQFSAGSSNTGWLDFWNDYRLPAVQTGAAFCANQGRYGILKGGFAGNYGGDPFKLWEYEISFIDMQTLITRHVWHGDRFFNVRGTPPGGPSDPTDPTVLLSPDCTYAVIVSAVTDRSVGPERRRVDVINLDTGNSAGTGPLFFGDPNVQPLFAADLSAVLMPSAADPTHQEVQLLLRNANWQKVAAP